MFALLNRNNLLKMYTSIACKVSMLVLRLPYAGGKLTLECDVRKIYVYSVQLQKRLNKTTETIG